MATEEPLSKEGRDLKVKCKSMAFYEVRYRLRTHEKEGPKAALVQFIDADGRPITEEHVSPGFSEEVGRYSYLKANPETGAGVVRFFAPTSGGRVTLRFRAWANRHPVLLGHDISVREVAGWTIAAERSNSEPIRLTSVARPLSVPVPAGAKAQLSVTLRSEADGRHIVLHAPCAMTMDGARVRLHEASEKAGSLRPFERRGAHVVLDVENPGQAPVILSLACEGVAAVDIEDVIVAVGMTAADDLANKAQPGAGALTTPIGSQGAKVRWATKVGNRLFLRSTIIDTRQELTRTADKVSQIERTLEESLLLVEKKVDYLLAKIDAYAEVDDRNGAALHEGLATVRKMAQDLGKTADANQAELRSWQEGVDGRLVSIERGNADLAGEVSAVRENGEKLGQAIKAGQQATDARLKDVEHKEQAVITRLTAIEIGSSDLARKLDAATQRLAGIEAAHAGTATAIEKNAQRTVADISKSVEKTAFNEFRQHEALDALQKLLRFELPLPATRGWAASPDFLLELYRHIATYRPKSVVELGSGVSTLVAAAALAANGEGGRIHSLDHEEAYAEATSKLLTRHGLSEIATVYHAPLAPWRPTRPTQLGEQWLWYLVPDAVDALDAIDLLVVDGPPEATGRSARYPAVPHFRARMAKNCTILLDDARRPDEKATAETWSREDALSLKLLLRADREFEKGLAILSSDGRNLNN